MGDGPRDGQTRDRLETREREDDGAGDRSEASLARAAERGELRGLMVSAIRRGRWDSAEAYLGFARRPTQSLEGLVEVAEAIEAGVTQVPEPRRGRVAAADELRALRLEAAEALRSRLRHLGLSPDDRHAMRVAARAFAQANDHARAAEMFERAEDFTGAAESWGALGELERMEEALARAEALREAARGPSRQWRDARERARHGDRRGALAVLAQLPAEHADAAEARRLAHELSTKLIRATSLLMRSPARELVRVSEVPALFGRDPSSTVPLRDPTISRQHARIGWLPPEARFVLEDCGSRTGVLVGPARVSSRLLLGERGSFSLGPSCVLDYQLLPSHQLRLAVTSGFDRGLVILLGRGPFALADAKLASAASDPATVSGARVAFSEGVARWHSPLGIRTVLDGTLADPAIDLLRGDRIRVIGMGEPAEEDGASPPAAWEVL